MQQTYTNNSTQSIIITHSYISYHTCDLQNQDQLLALPGFYGLLMHDEQRHIDQLSRYLAAARTLTTYCCRHIGPLLAKPTQIYITTDTPQTHTKGCIHENRRNTKKTGAV